MTQLEALAARAVSEAQGASDAAPGIARSDAEAVNAKASRELYASRKKVYAKLATGFFRNIKWAVMAFALGVYYLLPWLRWPRAPELPSQAVLLDFAHQRLFLGPVEIWPQEFYIITGILVVSALSLFLVTALAGRVWCGYACPQTVWTDLMVAIERFWQGDRNQRMKLDKEPWGARKLLLKGATHLSWILVGLLTGGALVFYFRDAPTLAHELVTGTAPIIAYIFLALFAGTTYLLGGIAREQVCTYMCPWPRIQGAMFDGDSLLVTYRGYRGEPRGPHKKGQSWEGRGDCIDCKLCVAVCPAGIDIRDGPQLECIQCALCVDACNEVMGKLGRPANLIGYSTFHQMDAAEHHLKAPMKLVRPRTILYSTLIAIVSAVTLWAVLARSTLEVNVLRDRNPLFVQLSDGNIRNGYTIKILNKRPEARDFRIEVKGLDGAKMSMVGFEALPEKVTVASDGLRQLKVYVEAPGPNTPGVDSRDFSFVITDLGDGAVSTNATNFKSPSP
ncbi:MAG: cytochrome c oxidase accessory protein CcoG [Hyphomicrobiaceae bacterium]